MIYYYPDMITLENNIRVSEITHFFTTFIRTTLIIGFAFVERLQFNHRVN